MASERAYFWRGAAFGVSAAYMLGAVACAVVGCLTGDHVWGWLMLVCSGASIAVRWLGDHWPGCGDAAQHNVRP